MAAVLAVALAPFAARAADDAPDRLGPPPRHGDYRIEPGDELKVQIFQEPDLDREVRVSQEGEITLPLIGRLQVKGATLDEVEETVRRLYDRDYLVDPQVNLIVEQYESRKVNVMGAVNSPQALECPPEQPLTLIDAISRAGGFNRFANRKAVRLTRTYPDGHSENFTIDADDLIAGKKKDQWVLQPEDVIYVPESIL